MTKNALIPALMPDGNLTKYLSRIRSFPMLEKDEEYMLAKAWSERDDVEAAHKLVTSHLRLVAKIAMLSSIASMLRDLVAPLTSMSRLTCHFGTVCHSQP